MEDHFSDGMDARLDASAIIRHALKIEDMHGVAIAELFGFNNYEEFMHSHKKGNIELDIKIRSILGPHGHAIVKAMKARKDG